MSVVRARASSCMHVRARTTSSHSLSLGMRWWMCVHAIYTSLCMHVRARTISSQRMAPCAEYDASIADGGGGGVQTVDLQRPSGRSSRVCLHTNVPSHRQVNVCQAVTAAPRSHKSVKDRGLGKREGWFVHRYRRHPTTLRYALPYEQCMHTSVSRRRLSACTTKCRAAVFRIHLGAPDDFIFSRFPS